MLESEHDYPADIAEGGCLSPAEPTAKRRRRFEI